MLATDETALVCDLAETYGIYDYRSYPATVIATFAVGLRENARIWLKMNKMAYPLETMLLASAVDKLSLLLWAKTKDGPAQDIATFSTPELFEDMWEQLAGGERVGGN